MDKENKEVITMSSGFTLRENILKKANGLIYCIFFALILIGVGIFSFLMFSRGVTTPSLKLILYSLYGMTAAVGIVTVICRGIKVIRPNEGAVFTLFGRYHATIIQSGLYFVNPFATEEGTIRIYGAGSYGGTVGSYLNGFGSGAHRIPLSPRVCNMKLDNIFNTRNGYVLSMGAKIEHRIKNPTKALFAVDNLDQYLYENYETVLREIIRKKIFYGETTKEHIDVLVNEVIKEIEVEAKAVVQEKLMFVGVEVLDITLKEVYDKKESRYYVITGD